MLSRQVAIDNLPCVTTTAARCRNTYTLRSTAFLPLNHMWQQGVFALQSIESKANNTILLDSAHRKHNAYKLCSWASIDGMQQHRITAGVWSEWHACSLNGHSGGNVAFLCMAPAAEVNAAALGKQGDGHPKAATV